MSRPPLAASVRCSNPECRARLGYVSQGERIGRYLVPDPGVKVRLVEAGGHRLICAACGAVTVHRWPKVAA